MAQHQAAGVRRHLTAANPHHRSYTVGPKQEFVATTAPGDVVRFTTLDASGDQIRPGKAFEDVDLAAMFPVTGPLALDHV